MKSTGITRKIDELGRIVLPIELRRSLGLEVGDPLEIYVEGDRVILHKYAPSCTFCGSVRNVTLFKEKPLCEKCLKELKALSGT